MEFTWLGLIGMIPRGSRDAGWTVTHLTFIIIIVDPKNADFPRLVGEKGGPFF